MQATMMRFHLANGITVVFEMAKWIVTLGNYVKKALVAMLEALRSFDAESEALIQKRANQTSR